MLVLAILVLDQLTKTLVLNMDVFNALACLDRTAACGRIELWSVMDLTMVWNRGFSFGLGQSEGVWRWLLLLVQLAVASFFFMWLRNQTRVFPSVALLLVIGGAIGNMIDRFRFGAVVDFFDFSGPWFGIEFVLRPELAFLEIPFAPPVFRDGILGLGFPYVFNVADAAITVGAIMILIDQFFLTRNEPASGTE